MRVFQFVAVMSILAGIALLAIGFTLGGGDPPLEPAVIEDTATPSNTATATSTATPTPTLTPTPTATPTPFDGAVTRFKIPRFNVDSAIEPIGILRNNQLDVPHNPHNTGWYYIYDKPGFGGNAVFAAHVDYYPNILGPFKHLFRLEAGDEVIVQMENGEEYVYRVIWKERYHKNNIPMGTLIWPPHKPEGVEWVTLITCGGEFRATSPSGAGEYLHRDVVVAERIR